jgi:tRNA(Arg) A34 adenosine deaminase TadA
MEAALAEAEAAFRRGEVPVGAALYDEAGALIAAAGNRILELKDPTAHAELLVLRAGAAALGNERLLGTTLVTTLEPCAMCAGAIALARVAVLVFGASDPKGGAILHGPRLFEQPTLNHRPRVLGPVGPAACGALLKSFFLRRRGSDKPR